MPPSEAPAFLRGSRQVTAAAPTSGPVIEHDEAAKPYVKPDTRKQTRQISAHFPGEDVHAFRILAASQDMDVQELLGEAINMVFERYGCPNRVPIISGRRKPLKR